MTNEQHIEHLTDELAKASALEQKLLDRIVDLQIERNNYKKWFEKASGEIQQLQQKLNANGKQD